MSRRRAIPLGTVLLLALPELATAQAYDSGDVTSSEQLVLEIINRARTNPTAEGTRLSIPGGIGEGLTAAEQANIGSRPPFAINKILLGVARAHSRDMYFRNFFGHVNPDGIDPFQRMTNAGYSWIGAAENIAVGSPVPSFPPNALEDSLMIDSLVAGRGHRKNLLSISGAASPPPVLREIGIGYYANSTANGQGWETFLTQDFGRRTGGPFLVGVVYTDLISANNFYDVGEGVPGVTITITAGGSGTATTAPGGGFVIPVGTSGTITVTASGGPLTAGTTLTTTAPLTGENVRIEFKTTAILDTDGDGIPDWWEDLYSLDKNLLADAAQDADGDGWTNLQEYRYGTNPRLAASTPHSGSGIANPPTPTTGGGGSTGGHKSGGCGLTGFEGLLPLALLRLLRRVRRP
jgi:uncharacterized protein YkwD